MSLEDTGVAPEAAPATTPPPATDTKPAAESAPPVEYRNEAEADAALTATLREKYRELTAPEAPEAPTRERDEAGRFVGKEPAAKPAEPAKSGETGKDEPAKAAKTGTEPAKPAEPGKPAADAPRSWAADMKAKWAAVPDDVKPYVAARETELHEAKSQIGRLEGIARPMQSLMAKHADYLKSAAADRPLDFVDSILTAAHKLDTNPDAAFAELAANMAPRFKDREAFVKSIARNLGVDLGRVYDPLEAPPDPRVLQLEQENRQWREYHERQERQRAAEAQQAEAAREEEKMSYVQKFMASKPDVFSSDAETERVWLEMSPIVAAIRARNPQLGVDAVLSEAWTAYERTLPASFEKLVAAEADKKLKEREAAAAEAAAKARAANSVNVRSAPNARESDSDDDETQRLRAVFRRRQAQ